MIAQIVGDDTEHLVAPARRRPLLLGATARRDIAKKDIEPSFARERPAFEPRVDSAVVLLEFHHDPLPGGATNLAEKANLASRVRKYVPEDTPQRLGARTLKQGLLFPVYGD